MKKSTKIFFILVISVLILLIFKTSVNAKSYTIEEMDIQATVNNNGSVSIKQNITFNFKGEYNGIYITVPYDFEDIEYEEVVNNIQLSNTYYSGSSVTVERVFEIEDGKKSLYKKTTEGFARNGVDGVYTETQSNRLKKIKVYSPSKDTTKTFQIEYIINDLCVKHNDVGELYYNFIGEAWEVEIKDLNIDIYIPR